MSTLHIVGGGLAGMTVAWDMAHARNTGFKRFDEIVLHEASGRLGGKAGSEATIDTYDESGKQSKSENADKWSDHGYHLFPVWYRNVIGLMGEIGVDYDRIVVEGEKFVSIPRTLAVEKLDPGRRPESGKPPLTRVKEFIGNKTPGLQVVDPMPDAKLIAAKKGSALQLILMGCTLPWLILESDRALKRHSVKGFLNWGFPLIGFMALPSYEGLILKALAADTDTMSAYALAKMFRRWTDPIRSLGGASWSSLHGSLQASFIEPFEQALIDRGVTVAKGHAIEKIETKDDCVTSLRFKGGEVISIDDGDHVVSAVPPDVLARVGPDQLSQVAAVLAEEMSTFSGVDIYFPNELTVPRQHFGFNIEPKDFGGTAYDIRPVWQESELSYDLPLVLQLVIPQMERHAKGRALDEDFVIDHVRQNLGGTFDFTNSKWFVHVNHTSPLSLSSLDAYKARDTLPEILRLSVAGDFMDSSIEVPSMEGAVGNGRRVAAELAGRNRQEGDPDVPQTPSRRTAVITLLAVVGLILAYAIALVASLYLIPRKIVRWIKGRLSRDTKGQP